MCDDPLRSLPPAESSGKMCSRLVVNDMFPLGNYIIWKPLRRCNEHVNLRIHSYFSSKLPESHPVPWRFPATSQSKQRKLSRASRKLPPPSHEMWRALAPSILFFLASMSSADVSLFMWRGRSCGCPCWCGVHASKPRKKIDRVIEGFDGYQEEVYDNFCHLISPWYYRKVSDTW